MDIITNNFEFEIFRIGAYSFKVYTLLSIGLIIVFAKLAIFLIKKALNRKSELSKKDKDNYYSLFQISRYLIWTVALGLILESLGIKLTILLAGSAALLVGVGLGLQHTFNDIMSGLILLFEGSIKVGDVLEVDGDVVKIHNIGLRTSKALNRDDIDIILPNSLITTNKVINWSHQSKKARFRISVGVAYGSDVDLVLKVLLESANEHPDTIDKKLTHARLTDFGNSSLDFQVLFFSRNIFRIERVKSEIRRIIDRKFRENNITIPFPQLDLHVKSDITGRAKN